MQKIWFYTGFSRSSAFWVLPGLQKMKGFFRRFNLDKISILLVGVFFCGVLYAAEEDYIITIKDHRFTPKELKIPSGKKIKIIVKNEDASPEEFESYELRREKVVSGHSSITVYVGPLKPGLYKYFGEFHADTAQGRLIAEENT